MIIISYIEKKKREKLTTITVDVYSDKNDGDDEILKKEKLYKMCKRES